MEARAVILHVSMRSGPEAKVLTVGSALSKGKDMPE